MEGHKRERIRWSTSVPTIDNMEDESSSLGRCAVKYEWNGETCVYIVNHCRG